jgi:hypothetical protein
MSLRLVDNQQSLELDTPAGGPYVKLGNAQDEPYMKIGAYNSVNNIENTSRDLVIAGSGTTMVRTSGGLTVEGPLRARVAVLPQNPNTAGSPPPTTPTPALGQVYWDSSSLWIYTGQWEKAQIGPPNV